MAGNTTSEINGAEFARGFVEWSRSRQREISSTLSPDEVERRKAQQTRDATSVGYSTGTEFVPHKQK